MARKLVITTRVPRCSYPSARGVQSLLILFALIRVQVFRLVQLELNMVYLLLVPNGTSHACMGMPESLRWPTRPRRTSRSNRPSDSHLTWRKTTAAAATRRAEGLLTPNDKGPRAVLPRDEFLKFKPFPYPLRTCAHLRWPQLSAEALTSEDLRIASRVSMSDL